MNSEPINVFHSGGIGDFIYALPTVQAIALNNPVIWWVRQLAWRTTVYNPASRFLLEQYKISEIKECQRDNIPLKWVSDMPDFRLIYKDAIIPENGIINVKLPVSGRHLIENYAIRYNIRLKDWKSPWLRLLSPTKRPCEEPFAIVSNTGRYLNTKANWYDTLEEAKRKYKLFFMGTDKEYANFVEKYGKIVWLEYYDTLELAQYMKEASVVITNQTCTLALAQGFGIPYYLDCSTDSVRFFNDTETLI